MESAINKLSDITYMAELIPPLAFLQNARMRRDKS